ncbi:DUF2493 domain-containing protein [Hyphomicrobium sp.]|uniref:DUF2493 domain-containing protein n=1 Tax=Hyphomicrobium sp. TaxID=82 RepID=UPI001D42CE67|nr:DUF2493 domain-containing protein [Hyphomicrobium sp.]MBY0559934.1 DUF2493 domain-containing protein [Hyphomicrobium sp.]
MMQDDLFPTVEPDRPYRLAVCGGRDFTNQDYLDAALDEIVKDKRLITVATGDARGADTLARVWAAKRGHELLRPFVADWKQWGKAAGMRRNVELLQIFKPDAVVAFEGGRGTRGMIEQARRRNIFVIIAGGSPDDILRFQRNAKTRKPAAAKNDLQPESP